MQSELVVSRLDTRLEDLHYVSCLEFSSKNTIIYIAGKLLEANTQQRCPVVIYDLLTKKVKSKSNQPQAPLKPQIYTSFPH